MDKAQIAYLSIGSNLGDRHNLLQQGIFELSKHVGKVLKISSVYENPPIGFNGEPFFNACLQLETSLSPNELLESLLKIERKFGRVRSGGKNFGSRSLDLDIIYYGKEIISTSTLTVPHPEMANRRFVLRPLTDIAPQYYHPVLKKDTRNLLQQCTDKSEMQKQPFKLYTSRVALFSRLQFMAIEGNIGVGKTTLTKKIAQDFNAKLILERFADNPFLPKFYDDPSRYAFPLEMSFLADRYQQFMDDTTQLDLFKNFLVSDYDIFKSLIFAQITLQKEEFNLYRKLFNFMYKEVKKPDLYVYLYQSPKRLLENIKKRGRQYELNIEAGYLEKINRGYLDFIKGLPKQNTMVIDLDELDFVADETDYETILEQLQLRIATLFS
ncbi:2-amino-4-hydroxy-6-hydroxymethyldihydropteridine diphosphokinase [Allomuricauda sp. SCSIO 65647]|uniref:2-amino-4-hydroxy-6- hydroxymethyldihydropteridine diphosphokinase n=1 Tax=Allomuricauda sp. SCSIO 65647 TaxID=2908843 RepID=UPI001F1B278E|nr:2-amino-4-hydroxy-6-hydroxymethyldihydropteridine diphosphokinase [Muricauda sp. SCSIO 65647]UJH68311.1 2-amino-4-hydroxy-6-hydroxymethyldihydropteridine diphosphokinase [Muricauda sp. SCSIO 65647]